MKKESLERKEERQILVFTLAKEELGLDLSCVREVLRAKEICRLPKTPPFIEGVINLRGSAVALIDLEKKLTAKQKENEGDKRIIVCKVNNFTVGLTVNSLREVIAIPKADIIPTPDVVSTQMEAEVISGLARIGEKIIPILDLEHLLTKKEATELSAIEQ